MTDTPADPPEYIQGPGPDYSPPPLETLIDPESRDHTHAVGRATCLAALAECGIRKGSKNWTTPNREGA